ncbi:hypothetical protein [Rhizohabitans arisaemae]|uniref:hypothetical protein n=1 Tax=Rhizohabitans arisaemae TaxID=2720610 RepID=UPI0024B1953D|nr:hypothetical protein [Rhizohabitans arisaemae]
MSTDTRLRGLIPAGWVAAPILLGYAAPQIPFDVIFLIMGGIGVIVGDTTQVLGPIEIDWLGTGIRFTAVAAGLAIAVTTWRHQRRRRDVCVRCGRGDHPVGPEPAYWQRWSTLAAFATIPLALAYGALKTAWGLGSHFALTKPELFKDIHFWSPGFGDTVVLAAVAVLLAVGFARGWTPSWIPRWMPLTAAAVGCAMLVPVGVMGSWRAFLMTSDPATGIEPWVFQWIYVLFLTWGLMLGTAAIGYHHRTRGACKSCHRG